VERKSNLDKTGAKTSIRQQQDDRALTISWFLLYSPD
jgi:hypothetical protein